MFLYGPGTGRKHTKNDMIPDIKTITRGKMETTAMTTKCFLERMNRNLDT